MSEAILAVLAFPVVLGLTLAFTSWAENKLRHEDPAGHTR